VTSGPSLGLSPQSPDINTKPTFVSPNPFTPLVKEEPRYSPLAYIDVEFKDPEKEEWRPTRALIDCGGQGSFINSNLSKNCQLPRKLKQHPISLVLADGSHSQAGHITHYNPLVLKTADHEENIGLDVSPTSHDIILGMPWLEKHDPAVRFGQRTITFDSAFCQKECTHHGRVLPLHTEPQPSCPSPNLSTLREPSPSSNRSTSRRAVFHTPPPVSIIGAAAFAHLCNQPDTQLFTVSFSPETMELSNIATHGTETDPDLSNIPPEYHEFAELFSKREAEKLPPHRPYDHEIPLVPGAKPPFGTIYSMSPTELETLRKYVEENLAKGFLRHSQSPCGAPVLFVKKSDGTLRLCVDYRGLNKITIKNRYPLPLIAELLDRISRAKYFTKFDVRDGYNRLRVASGEEWKTAFRCRYGLFEYTVMPFGLCNAPGTFQHYMNDTFRDFLDQFLIVYLDDLLIYSDNLAEHKRHVRMVLERLRDAGLCLKPSKCQFHVQEVAFLGFIVSSEGVRMDPSKVAAIAEWPVPKSVHDIRVFLGLANFYRRFIKDFSKVSAPITALLKKNKKFQWGTAAQQAFDQLRNAFTSDPILHHFDPKLATVLEADASDYALGAVISQRDPETGLLHPITFYSRKFNSAELNYEIYDKEMLAIVESMDRYRHYFEGLGHKTTVLSDHRNLSWFTETKMYNRRQARWAEKLARFDFVITFRPGKQSGKPDALSRRPDYTLGDNKEARTITFLKPEQFDTHSFELNSAVVESLGTNEERAEAIRNALPADPQIGPHLNYLRDPSITRPDDVAEYLRPFSIDREGLVLRNGLIYVPEGDSLKVAILREGHDAKTAGHLGQAKTLEIISRDYHWPGMRQFVNDYI